MGFLPSQAAASNLIADGAYAVSVSVPPALSSGTSSNVLGIVGCFRKGKAGIPIPVTMSSQSGVGPLLAAVGDGIVSPGTHIAYDGVREAISATPETQSFVLVPVRDGTETSATLNVPDNTGFATQTYTIGGTWAGAKTLTATLTPVGGGAAVAVTYVTGTNGDTSNPTAATQMLNAINLSPAVSGPNAFLQKATLSGLVITVTALASGTASNAIGTVSNTPTGMTFVAGGATLAGGAAPGNLATITFNDPGTLANGATGILSLSSGTVGASPMYQYALAFPYNGQQTWRNIVAYASPGGAFDAPTFKANFVAALNGTAANQSASALGVASSGASTGNPLAGTVVTASGGTDGAAGVTTSSLLGVDGLSRSGMYALRGQRFGGVLLAGCTDPAVDVPIQAFLDTVGGVGFTAFPSGTSTSSAQSSKSANALSNRRIIRIQDWVNAPDTLAGQTSALVSPLGSVAGIVLSLQPWQDPSNKPEGVAKGNVYSTEKTANNQPVDPSTEGATRKQLGFSYLTTGSPRSNGNIGLPHGKTSDGSNVADVRMYDYIAIRALAILKRYVGKNQTPPPASGFDADPVRNAIRNDFAALKQELTNASDPRVAAFGYQFTGSASQVAAGYCPWSIQGKTLAGIEFAIANIAVGTTVTVAA